HDVADLYSLNQEQLESLERMGPKSARNLIDEIGRSKKAELGRVIYAIGIRFVGERTGQLLAEHFESLERLMRAGTEDLVEVGEVGPKVAQAIGKFFQEKRNIAVLEKLRKAGVRFEVSSSERKAARGEGHLAGKQFVLTGP